VAHENSVENYGLVTVPAAHVEDPQDGHSLMSYGNQQARQYFTWGCDLCSVRGRSVQTKNGL
jgi:hypothetical protein